MYWYSSQLLESVSRQNFWQYAYYHSCSLCRTISWHNIENIAQYLLMAFASVCKYAHPYMPRHRFKKFCICWCVYEISSRGLKVMKNMGATRCQIQMCFAREKRQFEMIMLAKDMWDGMEADIWECASQGRAPTGDYLLHWVQGAIWPDKISPTFPPDRWSQCWVFKITLLSDQLFDHKVVSGTCLGVNFFMLEGSYMIVLADRW